MKPIAIGAAWALALTLALGLASCAPDTRDPAELPVTGAASGTGSLCGTGGTAYTITGTVVMDGSMADGTTVNNDSGFPEDGVVFLEGLPCRQAAIDSGDGTFTFELNDGDVANAGLGDNSQVVLVAWWVGEAFKEVAAVSTTFALADTDVGSLTMTWAEAGHMTVELSSGSGTIASVTAVGLDDDTHGFDMAALTGDLTFNTNYLPEGTWLFQIETDQGDVFLQNIYFKAATPSKGANQWFRTTLTL